MNVANQRRVLIITSSGGGGCLQAAVAKEQEEKHKNPDVVVIKRDIMKDYWCWKIIAKFGVFSWNFAQRKGNVAFIQFLQKCQPANDVLCYFQFFYHFLHLIMKENIDHVIDTQPQGTGAFLLALRIYNRLRKKNVILEKVVVDLPTERNTHFFRPIRRLSKRNKKLLRMVTIPPLLKEKETAAEFWKSHCNLLEHEVVYQKYFVRRAFCKIQGQKRAQTDVPVRIHFENAEEQRFLSKTLKMGSLRHEMGAHDARLLIAPQDKVIAILLGSQPSREATLGYVKRFLRLANEPTASRSPVHIFVFCSHHRVGEDSLLREVSDLVMRTKDYPSHVTVLPVGFQNDETVAQVFYRSDLTITRSGGQTAMELMCVMQGEIWIHSEAKKSFRQTEELSLDQLLRGIPGWEAGSALYLHKLWNAKIVTPDAFVPYGRKFLSKNTYTQTT